MKTKLLYSILALAALVRIAHLSAIWNSPVLTVPIIDAEYYHQMATALAAGVAEREAFFMSPLYPYAASWLYRLFGADLHVVVLAQFFVGLILVYLIYLLANRIFDKNTALLSAVLAALYRPFVYYESALLSATLILLLNACALLLLTSSTQKRAHYLVAGLLLGLSALTRPNVLLFVGLAVIYLLITGRSRAKFNGIWVLLGAALVLVPVAYRNYRVGGEWVLTTSSLGMNFYAGNNSKADGIYTQVPFVRSAEPKYENQDYREEASRRAGTELSPSAASRFWFLQGLKFISGHPLAAAKLFMRKFFLFFHAAEIPNNISLYVLQSFSPPLRLIPITFGLLAPLGFAFWLLFWRKFKYSLLHLYGLSYLLATLLFFAASEYRLTILLILIPSAAALLRELWDRIKSRSHKSFLTALAFVLLLAIPINMPTPFTNFMASPRMDFFNLGSVLQKQNRDQEAIPLFQYALTLDPNFAEAHLALADSYDNIGNRKAAAEERRRAGLSPQR